MVTTPGKRCPLNAAPGRILRALLPAALLALGAGSALAQESGPDIEKQVQELSRKISRELKENEEALARIARGERGEVKPVDVSLPGKDGEKTEKTEKTESSSGGT